MSLSSASSSDMEITAPVTKKQAKKQQSEPIDLKKKKKKTKVIEITVSTSESDQEEEEEEEEEEEVEMVTGESESEEKPKSKPKKTKLPEKSEIKKVKVSDVKEPKKAKKPEPTTKVANKNKKEVVHKAKKQDSDNKKSSKKKSHAKSTSGSSTNDEDDDVDTTATTTKKKVIPKKDQDIEVPEMTRLIAAYASGGDEKKIQMIYDTHPKIYQQLVELVKPYRKVWCYSSSPARLMLRLDGANFVMVDKLDNIVAITGSYKKKDDFPLESLYREHVDKKAPINKDNCDSRLFELLAAENSLTEPVDVSTKMQQCIIHDPDNEKSYWVNSPEGREKLGPVINTDIKKFDAKTIAAEIANVVSIRNAIIQLFVNIKNSPQTTASRNNSNSKKRSASDEVIEEKDVKKKKTTTAATTTTTDTPQSSSSSSSKKKETPPSPVKESKEKKKKTTTTTPPPITPKKDEKSKSSTKKIESVTPTTSISDKVAGDASKTSSGVGVKIRKSVVKPTNVAVKTTVTDVDEETKNRIMNMSPTEIYALLQEEKKKIDEYNKAEFENVEWYDRFDLLMGTNSKLVVNRSTPVIQTH